MIISTIISHIILEIQYFLSRKFWICGVFLLVIPTVYNNTYIMYNVFMRGLYPAYFTLEDYP